jgi:uncharacterized protein YjbI with pentapeptide repeats
MNAARMSSANFAQNNFSQAIMTNCDLHESNLSTADFSGAMLLSSNLREANIMATNFRGSVLEGARGLTGSQLSKSHTSQSTILPSGARGPFVQGQYSEMPVFR